MNNFKYPLRKDPVKISAEADFDDVIIGPVKNGEAWRIELCGMENETTAFTEIRAFIGRLTNQHYIFEQNNPRAAILYWFTNDFYLFENEKLTIRFTGCSNGDKLKVYLSGYRIKTGALGGIPS